MLFPLNAGFLPLPVSFVVFFGGNGILSLQFPMKKMHIMRYESSAGSYVNKEKTVQNVSYDTLIHDFDTLIRKFPVYEKYYVIVFPSNGRRR